MLFLCVFVVLATVAEGGLAPFITACRSTDTACHLSSVQKAIPVMAAGVPALGIRTMDPMTIAKVNADQAGLKVEFRDTVVKGLKNCRVLNVKRTNHRQTIETQCSVTLTGDYTLRGRLLVLPVEGNGRYKIKIRDIVVKVQYEIGESAVAGERHWSVLGWQHTAEVKGGAEFQFQNLFNGNKQLSDIVHQFANTNWSDIFQEVAPPIVKAIVGNIVEDVTRFFHKVPIGELSVD